MVRSELDAAAATLKNAGVEDYLFEARVIFETIFSRSFYLDLLAGRLDRDLSDEEKAKLSQMLSRRLGGEPLQYIIGEWEFYGEDFIVGKGVLIPRQDTETLIDEAVRLCSGLDSPKILDLCSGTGCIPITLSRLIPFAEVHAAELYPEAYSYLEKNILKHQSRVIPHMIDALADSSAAEFCGFDIITCNPPYLSGDDMACMQREVNFEPRSALYGGQDGLDYYRAISVLWHDSLKPGGYIIYEIGASQADEVKKILAAAGFDEIRVLKDAAGKDRAAVGRAKTAGK